MVVGVGVVVGVVVHPLTVARPVVVFMLGTSWEHTGDTGRTLHDVRSSECEPTAGKTKDDESQFCTV